MRWKEGDASGIWLNIRGENRQEDEKTGRAKKKIDAQGEQCMRTWLR
jgi:hypothetical protein